jgi:hypothetical protein
LNEDGTPGESSVAGGISFNAKPGDSGDVALTNLTLVGPGDIAGLDTHVVVRTWPRPNDRDAEFRSYALIEFDQADLPWRYTPAKNSGDPQTATDHLRPWFSLLVLTPDEAALNASTPDQPLQTLTVHDQSVLPVPTDAWAWAHTQFEGTALAEAELRERIQGPPGRAVARLFSPRLLQERTEYIACLVPSFEVGRLAGLGQSTTGISSAQLAWSTSGGELVFPVYYAWTFATGVVANFEDAARRLKPHVLPATVGRRDLDVAEPGLGLPAAMPNGQSLPVEGALFSLAAAQAPAPAWPEPQHGQFVTALQTLVNAPALAQSSNADPVVAPPLYGQWYAAQSRLLTPRPSGANPRWFHELNSDPSQRVAAALGTHVVQNEQQALLAAGWEQVEEIKTVNQKLRVVQLARGVLTRIYLRHYKTQNLEYFYHLSTGMHARVRCGDKSVCGRIKGSPIPRNSVALYWLRFTRRLGPVGRIQGRPPGGPPSDILRKLNEGKGPVQVPGITPHHMGDGPLPGGGVRVCVLIDTLAQINKDILLSWALAITWTYRKLLVSQSGDCWWIAVRALRFAVILVQIATDAEAVRRRCRMVDVPFGVTPADISSGPRYPQFPLPTLPPGASYPPVDATPTPPNPGAPGSTDNATADSIRKAILVALGYPRPFPKPALPPSIDLDRCYTELIAQLQPSVTVGKRVKDRIEIDTSTVEWNPSDPLSPIFAPPEYERPMYEPLLKISPSWLLPGIEELKRDTVSLAVPNQRFIESYMLGLNHEMTRELLWNEFPTDQRGTYFRQFWSIASQVFQDGSALPPEQLRDILPLKLWSKDAALGENSPRTGAGLTFLVLVVKAQLIQKYPNLILYAQKLNAAGNSLAGEQRYPFFNAKIGEDVSFFGFDLTESQLKTEGWYFVFQEQPGEPKFADELSPRGPSQRYTSDATLLANSSGILAQRTYLKPFRIGIAGTTLLPQVGS